MATIEQEEPNAQKRNISIQYFKAKHLQREKKIAEAIALYETITITNEAPIAAYIRLGELYESVMNTDKAIETYKRGIEVSQSTRDKRLEHFLQYSISSLLV
jgi:tetratricopeptide (TPR) repeat protein